ncbi:MAG: sulfotransferase [Pseudomonadota bacterium]
MTDPNPMSDALAAFQRGDLDDARRLAEGIVAADGGSASAHHLLGLIQCRSGRFEDGIKALGRATEIEPANLAFRVMLARALVDSSRGSEALAIAVRPEGKDAANPVLWHARAEAADCAKDYAASSEAWLRVGSLNPSDWRAWSNAGNALAGLEQWSEAADAFRHAARLNPGEIPIRRNLVSALSLSKQLAEARAEAEALLAGDPGDTMPRMLLAKILSEMGFQHESLGHYDEGVRQALDRAGDDPGPGLLELGRRPAADAGDAGDYDIAILLSLAYLLERTSRFDELRALLAAADRAGIDGQEFASAAAAIALRDGDPATAKRLLDDEQIAGDPGYLHRLKAKVEDALGNHSAAFAEATAMNRSVDDFAGWRKKGADYRTRLRAMRRQADLHGGKITPVAPGKRRSPAFLVGFPRSGTTLLDTFLMGHPETQVLEEVHMLGAAETSLGGATNLDQRTALELERARAAYFAELDRHVDPGFTGLVVDKLPLNMLGLPLIYALFPDARIIFSQRHPADCVLSCFMQNFILNDAMASFLEIGDCAEMYDASMDQFMSSRERVPLAVHTLVYEQLIADAEGELRPLIAFLGLEWKAQLLDHRATAMTRGAIITPSYDQVVKPLNAAPSGRWRRYEAELAPVLPVLLHWAQRLGYSSEVGENSQTV